MSAVQRAAIMALTAVFLMHPCASSDAAAADGAVRTALNPAMAADLARVRDAALSGDWAYERLEELTDRIGPRLSGSPQQLAAVHQVADALRALGARVTLQPAKVPHWIRGDEHAELTGYAGRPAGLTQQLHLTALGGSGATPGGGVETTVVVVHDFAELAARAGEVRGRIVLFDVHFDRRWADSGHDLEAYRRAVAYRGGGPAAAARLGAAVALVRSVGGAEYRLPHTGMTRWDEQQTPIPAAALAAEDADLIVRLARQGPVTMKVSLTPRTLPDADSFNVIADWPGRAPSGEYVIVSGHLDSWDLGTGATDDGAGVMGAAGVIEVLHRLNLHPRRTVRFIAWASEETGSQGAQAYFRALQGDLGSQCAAIESDHGAGRAIGIEAAVSPDSQALLAPVIEALAPLGASILEPKDGEVGADIGALQESGVPGFAPLTDSRRYFDYHHTAADTLDKVDPSDLKTHVAVMATLAYFLAERETCLPRVPAAASARR